MRTPLLDDLPAILNRDVMTYSQFQPKSACPPSSDATDSALQDVLAWRQQAVKNNRSKSLTRLDEFGDNGNVDMIMDSSPAELQQ